MGANQAPQREKRVISAKSLANLRPHPQNMRHRGGSKRREYVTSLLLRPLIDKTFKELQEKRKDQSVEAADRRREERAEFLHQELMHRLRTAVTHERTGDLGIAKMLEVGFKSTGRDRGQKRHGHSKRNSTSKRYCRD